MLWRLLAFCMLSLSVLSCRDSNVTDTSFSPLPTEDNNRVEKIGDFLDERISSNSLKPDYYFQRSKVHFEERDFKSALRDIQASIQLDSTQSRFFFWRAVILYDLGTYQEALKSAKRAERMSYQSIALDMLMSKLYYANGEVNQSMRYLRQARQTLPSSPTISYLYGAIYADAQDTAQAFNELNEAIRLDSSYTDAYSKLISTYRKYGFLDKAMYYGEAAIRNSRENNGLMYEIATTLLAQEKTEEAYVWYQKLFNADRTSWQANLGIAKYYIARKEYLKAESYYNTALEYNPNITGGYYQLGYIYEYYAKEPKKAVRYYKKAVRLNRGNEEIAQALDRATRKAEGRYNPTPIKSAPDSTSAS